MLTTMIIITMLIIIQILLIIMIIIIIRKKKKTTKNNINTDNNNNKHEINVSDNIDGGATREHEEDIDMKQQNGLRTLNAPEKAWPLQMKRMGAKTGWKHTQVHKLRI